MEYYHGTTVGGLRILKPFANPRSNLKQPCVYLSTVREIAALYIWKHPFMWLTFEFGPGDDQPVYYECFPGQLERFYQGVSGYIYTIEGAFETPPGVGIRCAAVSERPVPVMACEHIADVREALLAYEATGRLSILRFDQLPETKHEANRDMILGAIQRLNLLQEAGPMATFVKTTFPEHWADALTNRRHPAGSDKAYLPPSEVRDPSSSSDELRQSNQPSHRKQ